jgi:hypothetical protein
VGDVAPVAGFVQLIVTVAASKERAENQSAADLKGTWSRTKWTNTAARTKPTTTRTSGPAHLFTAGEIFIFLKTPSAPTTSPPRPFD